MNDLRKNETAQTGNINRIVFILLLLSFTQIHEHGNAPYTAPVLAAMFFVIALLFFFFFKKKKNLSKKPCRTQRI